MALPKSAEGAKFSLAEDSYPVEVGCNAFPYEFP